MSEELRACPHCGSVLEHCTACEEHDRRAAEVTTQMALLEKDMRKMRAENARLKTQLTSQRSESPNAKAARELFDYWVKATKRNPKRTVYGDKRQDVILKALKTYPPEVIRHAIEGAALEPYRKGAKVYDDLTTILRDESKIEHFRDVFEKRGVVPEPEPEPKPKATASSIRDRLNAGPSYGSFDPAPWERALATFKLEYGSDRVLELEYTRPRTFLAPCPLHPTPYEPHLVVRTSGGDRDGLELRCDHGCLPSRIQEALLELEKRQEARHVSEQELRRMVLFMGALRKQWLIDSIDETGGPGEGDRDHDDAPGPAVPVVRDEHGEGSRHQGPGGQPRGRPSVHSVRRTLQEQATR